jgi:hypothetical protein
LPSGIFSDKPEAGLTASQPDGSAAVPIRAASPQRQGKGKSAQNISWTVALVFERLLDKKRSDYLYNLVQRLYLFVIRIKQ